MRSQTRPLDRGEPAFDVTVQIVLNDFGQPLGRVYRRSALCEISDARLITAGIDDDKGRDVRFWHLADISTESPISAFGAKADIRLIQLLGLPMCLKQRLDRRSS